METSSKVLTEGQGRQASEVAEELSRILFIKHAHSEAERVAAAVLHDAVSAAASGHTVDLVAHTEPLGPEVLACYLKTPSNYPTIIEAVMKVTAPAAKEAALLTLRTWTRERALTEAKARAFTTLEQAFLKDADRVRTELLAGLSDQQKQEVLSADLEKELERRADELTAARVERLLTAQVRRDSQSAASKAVEEIARQAPGEDAHTQAQNAARAAAVKTAKAEITAFLLAEVQRRASRETRERLKDREDKSPQQCYEEAITIARESLENALGEILVTGSDLNPDNKRLLELATGAASAAARDLCEPMQAAEPEEPEPDSKVQVFIVSQVIVGIVLIWLFLLGGTQQIEPAMRTILPDSLYSIFYPQGKPKDPEMDNILDGKDPFDEELGPNPPQGSEKTPPNPEVKDSPDGVVPDGTEPASPIEAGGTKEQKDGQADPEASQPDPKARLTDPKAGQQGPETAQPDPSKTSQTDL